MVCVMIHGVPDTPILWDALIKQLDLGKDQVRTPALPGFTAPPPAGFTASKEAYLDWLIDLLEVEYAATGPIDLVGHDWGAILCIRAAHMRPDLIRSWTAMNAVIMPGARWHRGARHLQTPVVGDVLMTCLRPWLMRKILPTLGMPTSLAVTETIHFTRHMKRAILRLYRSAKDVDREWARDLSNLPKRGLVIWAGRDRFMPLRKAKRFSKEWNVPLRVNTELGHWSLCEDPRAVADPLRAHLDQA